MISVTWMKRTTLFRLAIAPMLVSATVYLSIVTTVYLGQRKLQYAPNPATPNRIPDDLEEITLTTEDNVRLKAWVGRAHSPQAVLLLHGNGGNRSGFNTIIRGFAQLGYRPLVLDYRGYGGSEGSPSEQGLYRDAEAAWRWLEANGAEEIILWGYSLGTGVAVEMAVRHETRALILDAPFDSAVTLAGRIYPWLPTSLLLKDRYESDRKIAAIECPLLVVHGMRDRVIPIERGRALFELATAPKRWVPIEGAGHNNLHAIAGDTYWTAVRRLLQTTPHRH